LKVPAAPSKPYSSAKNAVPLSHSQAIPAGTAAASLVSSSYDAPPAVGERCTRLPKPCLSKAS
jgi:hypothetical protein